jgi:thioredoxin reductase (NADPH)
MMAWLPLYLLVAAAVLAWYLRRRRRVLRAHAAALQQAIEAGLVEPPSLHPLIDPSRCIGSQSCVQACPEGTLGVVGGKAVLTDASACIGHGACAAACPLDAITLVFGSERRGIDIPELTPSFETNVPGLFIAGELGGMGLIRKAAEQGRQAVDSMRRRPRLHFEHDLVIVGCGPAGLSAGLSAIRHGLRYRLIEQEHSLGGAIFHYPRHKIAMTAAVRLDLIGEMRLGEVSKERLLEFWQQAVDLAGLEVGFGERLEAIEPDGEGFVVTTSARTRLATRSVLLAMGRRGSPRRLGVPGEDSAKVVYRLVDPAQYRGHRVLVVGGGDSALEAALALAGEAGTATTLSYRGRAFDRVKAKNRLRLEAAAQSGRVRLLMGSEVTAIEPGQVRLRQEDRELALDNDEVIVCAGGQLPIALLQKVGIRFQTKYGTA